MVLAWCSKTTKRKNVVRKGRPIPPACLSCVSCHFHTLIFKTHTPKKWCSRQREQALLGEPSRALLHLLLVQLLVLQLPLVYLVRLGVDLLRDDARFP